MRSRLGALLGLGLLLNLGLLYLYYTPAPKTLQGDEYHYLAVATAVASGRHVEPNPFWPPLYGQLMGHLFAIFGVHRLAIQVAQIVLWLAAGVLIRRTAAQLASDPLAADVSAGLFLLSPELMAFTHFLWAEMVHLVFCVAALWLLVCHGRRLVAVAASGVFLGLALVTKLLLAPLAPLVPVAFALCAPMPWRARFIRALLLAAMMGVTLTPTMLGNLARHEPLLGADSSMFVVWLGLNPAPDHPRALLEFLGSGRDMATRNAVYREKIRRQVRTQGVIPILKRQLARQYFLLFSYETWFTLQLPGARPPMRGRYHFDDPRLTGALHVYAHLVHAILLAGMALGVAAVRPRHAGWWNALLAFLGYNLALYLVANTNARYFVQMMPAAMLFAGIGIAWIVRLARGEAMEATPAFAFTGVRLGLGIGLVALVEFLAFRNLPTSGI